MKTSQLILLLAGLLSAVPVSSDHSGLYVQFGSQGLEKLSYNGKVLEDLSQWPDDQFHIWHMKFIDAGGHPRSDGEYGWGENKEGRSWDQATQSWTYKFVWGSIRTQYAQNGDSLDLQITETNHGNSGVTLDGASIYPVKLHPLSAATGARVVDGLEEPVAVAATWADTEAVVVAPKPVKAIYGGLEPGANGSLAMIASGTLPDSIPEGEGGHGRGVKPGETDSFVVSLRFAPNATALSAIAADAYQQWNEIHPVKLNWSDRRIIGTVYLASAGQGDKTHPAGYPTNPRRYFNDPAVDVNSAAGLQQFQARVLKQAQTVVTNLRKLNAQGAITWDVEGEQYPQDTSYICSPDQIATAAPEMESVLPAGSPYAGMKLDDAYFRTIRDAGFRVGVCVRPQHFTMYGGGTATQAFLPDARVADELIHKMKYAHDRWGATIFYLDSTVRQSGWTLPAAILEQASAALPDSLLIPEESTPRMYNCTAPFLSFIFHGDTGINPLVRFFYPNAFGVNLINDVAPDKLAQAHADLVNAVRKGDILMVHAGYWQANNPTVVSIYREAGR